MGVTKVRGMGLKLPSHHLMNVMNADGSGEALTQSK